MRPSRPAVVLVALLLLAGCALAPASPSPVPTPRPELAWDRAAIDLPAEVSEQAPGSTAGIQCSPCHARRASLLHGVTATADGFLAVGVVLPPSEALAYRSRDGTTWTPEPGFGGAVDTAANAAATDGPRVVVVGSRGPAAASWASSSAGTWAEAPGDPDLQPPDGGTAQMRAVVAWNGTFVAVGSRDRGADVRAGAAWTSADGVTWTAARAGPGWDGGAAYGVAASGDTVVAVGEAIAGPAAHGVAWVSDGGAWTRVDSPALADGTLRAVAWTGRAFVAVGYARADDRAMAWTSPDGREWSAVPASGAFRNAGRPIRILAVTGAAPVAAGGSPSPGVLAAGWASDAGNGSGMVWSSPDGIAWTRLIDQASMSGASLSGAAVGPAAGGADPPFVPVVVGTSGYPDNDQASAWHPVGNLQGTP